MFLQTKMFSIFIYYIKLNWMNYFVQRGFAAVYICIPVFSQLTGYNIFPSIMELQLNWCTSSNWDQSRNQRWAWPVIRGIKMKMINVFCCDAAAEHRGCAAFLSLHLYVQQDSPPPHPHFNYSSARSSVTIGCVDTRGGAHLSRSNSTSSTRKSLVSTSLWICCRSSSSFCRSSLDLSLSAETTAIKHSYLFSCWESQKLCETTHRLFY